MKLIMYTDGGARGNPGPAGIGVFITDETGKMLEEHAVFLGHATNNQAEYKAVLLALERALALGAEGVEIRADSELLIKQANGEYKVKHPNIAPLYLQMKNFETALGNRVRYRHVRREKNKDADRLANEAMDKGMGRPK